MTASPHRHPHAHAAHVRTPPLRASWLRWSAAHRLAGVGVLIAALWLAVFWALS